MASSFEKSVKGGTKIKLAAPKSKYVEHILIATHAGEAGVAEIFRALTNRLRDSTWTIVFKSLIIVHLMIREGEPDVTLKYLAQNPQRKLAINHFTEVQTQGRNIQTYSEYLLRRAVEYGTTKVDYVRGGEGRLKRLTVDKGLLRETESVQDQIRYLLKCELLTEEPENEITLTAFRLLTMDLLALFHVMNEGTINVLEHYFEMSHPDATRALNIYRTFVKQTDLVVQYLSVARMHEHSTRLEIPKIKHAPTSLAASLEEYLNDKDFEINRRQYLAEKEAKKNSGKSTNGSSKLFGDAKPTPSKTGAGQSFPSPTKASAAPAKQEPKGPAPDLIDFFESIEQNQQPMAQQTAQYQQYAQQMGVSQVGYQMPIQTAGFQQSQQPQPFSPQVGQPNDPFRQPQQLLQQQQVQPSFTGAGFGGYTPQPFSPQNTSLSSIPQNGVANFSQQPTQQFSTSSAVAQPLNPQSTNPFRNSLMPNNLSTEPKLLSNPTVASPLARSPTNPFAKHGSVLQQQSPAMSSSPFAPVPSIQAPQSGSPFAQPQMPQPQPQLQQDLQHMQPAATGTNPFARHPSPNQQTPSPQAGLMPNVAGSTNPFRQSAFVNQQTGQGWQNTAQGTVGGMRLEQLETVPVFPRPGQPPAQQGAPQGWS
ncbi:ANTH-domain-containing protein [Lepidopterella palustris CBS 459.81]|uniref:ANTH-domain-containing protein n=1 Tax=Lepidopterella palustris CBS 459.81 TaxID=1314670 RepID=A0A8E2EGP6_9PEZI|nr:ANTH-domain-containing protein [Lepidopterella palustris CBS 459.81]